MTATPRLDEAGMTPDQSTAPDPENRDNSPQRQREERLMRLATFASVGVASTLIGVKIVAWLMTGSVSMLSTLVDSCLDAAASLLNLFAVRHALRPADDDHRFGHGKAEALSALAQATFIAGSGLFLAVEAGKRLFAPQEITEGETGIVVMLISIGMTLLLVMFQNYVLKHTRSLAIDADSLHYKGDLLVNVGVIAAIILSSGMLFQDERMFLADPLIGLVIAGYIIWNAWTIVVGSYNELMDRELPPEDRERIVELALDHPEVLALHDLRTRSSGRATFIQLHIEMDAQISLVRAHAIADSVEYRLRKAFPGADIIVHQDPFDDHEDSMERRVSSEQDSVEGASTESAAL